MGICRVLAILYNFLVYHANQVGVLLWWTHIICMARLVVLSSICSYGGIVGSTYVMVSALKYAITCEFGKGPP